jgi:PAS domain S-box-containing protein
VSSSSTISRPAEDALPAIEQAYGDLLRRCCAGFEEATQQAAHELGRDALTRGMGVLDLVDLHHRSLAPCLASLTAPAVADAVEAASRLLAEALSPFEMVHRGFRAANHALRASEDRYRDLFENANDAIFTTDLKGRLTSLNRAAELLTGYPREEALALSLPALIAAPNRRSTGRPRNLRLGLIEDQRRYELEIVTRDGRRVPVEVSTRRIYDGATLVGLQGIARDISDRRNAEAALRDLNARLEEKAKSIAHGLHDEAGQLLAAVYLRIAEIATDLPQLGRQRVEDLRTLLDQVDDQIRRLAHELRPSVLDDLGLIPACHLLAEGVSKRAGLTIDVTGSTHGRLPADVETALYRVAQEALTNVMRHAGARHVRVHIERAGRRVRGHVSDDGHGFDRARMAAPAGGRGLGLRGMRERLMAVGGRLDVKSTPDHGTSVEFELPLED